MFFFDTPATTLLIEPLQIDSRGKFNIPRMFLHRYLRVMPALGILILIVLSILKHLGSGPMWHFVSNGALIGQCEKYWWSALLNIQNYYNPLEVVSYIHRR